MNQRNDIDILRRRMDAWVLLVKSVGGGRDGTKLPTADALISVAVQGDLAAKRAIQIDEVDCRQRTGNRPPDQTDP